MESDESRDEQPRRPGWRLNERTPSEWVRGRAVRIEVERGRPCAFEAHRQAQAELASYVAEGRPLPTLLPIEDRDRDVFERIFDAHHLVTTAGLTIEEAWRLVNFKAGRAVPDLPPEER